jgi:hypothetical protein
MKPPKGAPGGDSAWSGASRRLGGGMGYAAERNLCDSWRHQWSVTWLSTEMIIADVAISYLVTFFQFGPCPAWPWRQYIAIAHRTI